MEPIKGDHVLLSVDVDPLFYRSRNAPDVPNRVRCFLMTAFKDAAPRQLNPAGVSWRRPLSPAEGAVVLEWRSAGQLSNRHSAEFEISLRQGPGRQTSSQLGWGWVRMSIHRCICHLAPVGPIQIPARTSNPVDSLYHVLVRQGGPRYGVYAVRRGKPREKGSLCFQKPKTQCGLLRYG
ncbi:hypothetical protein BJX96DRAFT_26286 [Aspergillus floccosus]